MKDHFTKITKALLDIMFVCGIITVLTLPVSIKAYGEYKKYDLESYLWSMVIVFAICGILCLTIVWELRKMFKTVIKDDCFVRQNITSLNKMGIYSFAIAAALIIKSIIHFTLAGIAMIIVFIVAGLFSRVLAQVFDRAVTYKKENDLTI